MLVPEETVIITRVVIVTIIEASKGMLERIDSI